MPPTPPGRQQSITRGIACLTAILVLVAPWPGWAQLPPPGPGFEPGSFINYETPHVHPLDLTPDRALLLAVNTASGTLMVFELTLGLPQQIHSIPVGLDPVSVRARSDDEAWVVNHVSDTVSIVDLRLGVVVATLHTDDEPADVVFAGAPERAFVTCSQANRVQVFDPEQPESLPTTLVIAGEDPRALAVSPDGGTVYAAIFESTNGTTLVPGGKDVPDRIRDVVRAPEGPYGGLDIPHNRGMLFEPPLNPANPPQIAVSMIVRESDAGLWLDDNGGDWTELISGALADSVGDRVVGWQLPDRDVAVIDAVSLGVTYRTRLMNAVMAIDVHPQTGEVFAVGTDATNEIRWEPNLQGTFLRVNVASFAAGGPAAVTDLNPHLDYSAPRVPQLVRDRSIGDPRGIAWRPDGGEAYVTGMGSNNVVIIDANGARLGRIEVGEGPTGIVVADATRGFVLNRFEGSLSVLDLATRSEQARVAFHDPTPEAIRRGRPHLYDTHATSGLGQASCASCHIDARTDRLAWDLGNPAGDMRTINGFIYHPLKGPMKTQTLQDIIGAPALHHNGDSADIFAFAGAFENLQGDDAPLDGASMVELESFLATIHYPPNPNRNIDNSLSSVVPIPGANSTVRAFDDAQAGLQSFLTGQGTSSTCASCHLGPRFRSATITQGTGFILGQPLVAEDLRGFYDRSGLFWEVADGSTSGFGYRPDGAQSAELRHRTRDFPLDTESGTHIFAFLLSLEGPVDGIGGFARDSHAGTGQQVQLSPANLTDAQTLVTIADTGNVGLVAAGIYGGVTRGFEYAGAQQFHADRQGELVTFTELLAAAADGEPLAMMLVPRGSETRLGIDRDEDGVANGDALFLASPGRQTSTAGDPVQLQIQATHHLSHPLAYRASGLPPGLTLNASSGIISGEPDSPGVFDVAVTVGDGLRDFAGTRFLWIVRPGAPCTLLEQQAELADWAGDFIVPAGETEPYHVLVPDGTGDAQSVGSASRTRFCFDVPGTTTYRIRGWVRSDTDGDNSFFVQVNGNPSDGILWDTPVSTTFVADYVRDRGETDPYTVSLNPGTHVVDVFLREDGTRLDRLQLEPVATTGNPAGRPLRFALEQNRPNPFNPTTRIAFATETPGPVRLRIYDPLGRLARTLIDEIRAPGMHGAVFDGMSEDGEALASGVYLYVLEAGGRRQVRRMTLVK